MRWKLALFVLLPLAFLVCSPVLFLLTGSLMDPGELSQYLSPILSQGKGYVAWRLVPQSPSLRSYVELLLDSPEFFAMFWNSVRITALILVGQLLVGAPAAWGFARFQFRFRKTLFTLYLILMLMPFQVTMLSSFLVLDSIHLINTQWSVILPAVFSTFPVFLMYRFFRSIPEAILESAKLDTGSAFQIFLNIGLPLGSAGIVSELVLGFLENWNLIEQPLAFLKDKTLWPLSLYLPNIDLAKAGVAFTGSVVTLLPALLVFLSGQDYLEQGITAAAIKG